MYRSHVRYHEVTNYLWQPVITENSRRAGSLFYNHVLQEVDHCFTITSYRSWITVLQTRLTGAGSLFYNHKQFLSIVLTTRRRFWKQIRVYRKKVLMVSKVMVIQFLILLFLSLLGRRWIYRTKHASFGESGKEVPFVIFGDKACRLKTFVMKPFARKDV